LCYAFGKISGETVMADIKLNRVHALGLKGAHAAADKMAEKLGKQFGLSGKWQGDTLHFDRPGVAGLLTVSERDMQLEVTLGFLLKAMRGPIERSVHEQLDAVLAQPPTPAPKSKPGAKTTVKKATGAGKKSA
jgi:putative polyhydroxyalkanoate system protein